MIPAVVRYHRASSLDDALAVLAETDARALAGGQSLLPVMKLRVARPSLLVDIGDLPLGGIEEVDGRVRLGALCTWAELERSARFARPALAAIPECARGIGDLQVRNRGTLGGSLAHADPASDMPAVLLALGAVVRCRSNERDRTLPVSELFLGPFTTTLADGELIIAVELPEPDPGSGSAYVSVEHPASGFPLAGAAASVAADGRETIAVTGVAHAPLLLAGGDRSALDAVEVAGDRFARAEYRRELVSVLVDRALTRARARAAEDRS